MLCPRISTILLQSSLSTDGFLGAEMNEYMDKGEGYFGRG